MVQADLNFEIDKSDDAGRPVVKVGGAFEETGDGHLTDLWILGDIEHGKEEEEGLSKLQVLSVVFSLNSPQVPLS